MINEKRHSRLGEYRSGLSEKFRFQGTPSIAGRPLLPLCGNSPRAELLNAKEFRSLR